jgi:DNA-binding transcriptional regulator YdaS (Cro superfamily)
LLQVTPAVVHQWVHGIRRVPVERCTEIERATASVVTCEELRPDRAEHWAYLRSTSPKDGELAQPVGREAA